MRESKLFYVYTAPIVTSSNDAEIYWGNHSCLHSGFQFFTGAVIIRFMFAVFSHFCKDLQSQRFDEAKRQSEGDQVDSFCQIADRTQGQANGDPKRSHFSSFVETPERSKSIENLLKFRSPSEVHFSPVHVQYHGEPPEHGAHSPAYEDVPTSEEELEEPDGGEEMKIDDAKQKEETNGSNTPSSVGSAEGSRPQTENGRSVGPHPLPVYGDFENGRPLGEHDDHAGKSAQLDNDNKLYPPTLVVVSCSICDDNNLFGACLRTPMNIYSL